MRTFSMDRDVATLGTWLRLFEDGKLVGEPARYPTEYAAQLSGKVWIAAEPIKPDANVARHEYRVLTDAEKANMVLVKDAVKALIEAIDKAGQSADMTVAKRKAQEAGFWAVYHITK